MALADINNFVELYNAFLGTELSSTEMWLTGRHIIETEKAFNTVHAGFTRSDDALMDMDSKLLASVQPSASGLR